MFVTCSSDCLSIKMKICPKCHLTIEQRKTMYIDDCRCEDDYIGNEDN